MQYISRACIVPNFPLFVQKKTVLSPALPRHAVVLTKAGQGKGFNLNPQPAMGGL